MSTFHTRPAQPADRLALRNLLHTAFNIHNHLDWQPPEAWLGHHPFYLAFADDKLTGAFAAPPDPPGTAWIRLAAVAPESDPGSVLAPLWASTHAALSDLKTRHVACMLLDDWLTPVLQQWRFAQINDVVVLSRENERSGWRLFSRPPASPRKQHTKLPLHLRPLQSEDLPVIAAIDQAAFDPPWQYSAAVITQALTHASWVTVAELYGEIVGYQISSGGRRNGHLARLAVLPEHQNQGVGRALVADLIHHFESRGAATITVNTQHDNYSSLALYQALGFKLTGDYYPVWQYMMAPE